MLARDVIFKNVVWVWGFSRSWDNRICIFSSLFRRDNPGIETARSHIHISSCAHSHSWRYGIIKNCFIYSYSLMAYIAGCGDIRAGIHSFTIASFCPSQSHSFKWIHDWPDNAIFKSFTKACDLRVSKPLVKWILDSPDAAMFDVPTHSSLPFACPLWIQVRKRSFIY